MEITYGQLEILYKSLSESDFYTYFNQFGYFNETCVNVPKLRILCQGICDGNDILYNNNNTNENFFVNAVIVKSNILCLSKLDKYEVKELEPEVGKYYLCYTKNNSIIHIESKQFIKVLSKQNNNTYLISLCSNKEEPINPSTLFYVRILFKDDSNNWIFMIDSTVYIVDLIKEC